MATALSSNLVIQLYTNLGLKVVVWNVCDTLIFPDWFLIARHYGGSDLLHIGVGVDCDISTRRPFLLSPRGELEVEIERGSRETSEIEAWKEKGGKSES